MDFLEIKPEKVKRIHQKEMGHMGHIFGRFTVILGTKREETRFSYYYKTRILDEKG